MQDFNETYKIDVGLVAQTLNNSNATGAYHAMKDYHGGIAMCSSGAQAATKTTKLEVFEAKDSAGTDAQLMPSATSTVTANANVTKATVAFATVLAAQTVTINGLVFTAHATVTTAADREFSISGNDSADGDELVTLINDATYGVPGVTAVNASGTLTLTVDDPGSKTLTLSASDSTFTLATVEAQQFVEFKNFDLSAGFTHVATKVTTTGNTPVGTLLLRGTKREAVTQHVGASASL